MSRKDLITKYNQTSAAVKIYKASKVRLGVQYDLLIERLRSLDSQIVAIDIQRAAPARVTTQSIKH
jgi:hypothetical protein